MVSRSLLVCTQLVRNWTIKRLSVYQVTAMLEMYPQPWESEYDLPARASIVS